jgi:hypothetical protein
MQSSFIASLARYLYQKLTLRVLFSFYIPRRLIEDFALDVYFSSDYSSMFDTKDTPCVVYFKDSIVSSKERSKHIQLIGELFW